MDQPVDVEKSSEGSVVFPISNSVEKPTLSSESSVIASVPVRRKVARWIISVESLTGLEARGIARVPAEERHEASSLNYAQMAIFWFCVNVTSTNLIVGLLGPSVFSLGFIDSAMMATFGCLVGSAGTAYMSIWGAQSGNRTMVCYSLLD